MDAEAIGTGVFGVIASAWAAFQTWASAQRQKELAQANAKVVENTEAAAVSKQYADAIPKLEKRLEDWAKRYDHDAAEWRARYDRLNDEQQKDRDQHEKDRTYWHDKAKEDNAIHLKLQEENATLKARTDLKPLIEILASMREDRREDVTMRVRLLEGLNGFADAINRLHERMDRIEGLTPKSLPPKPKS